ncbi:MAG: GTPase Era [Proteobacteria bacterium]|nr:GTPase Era [Pseudomonadota bacterium]
MSKQPFKSGFVTLLGKPNVGKSTLLNSLIGQQISITADKPQTTRNRIRGIITEETFQAVILDTPGIHLPKSELHRRIVSYAVQSVHDTDLVFFLTEPLRVRQDRVSDEDQLVLSHLQKISGKVVLVINKVDLSRHERILKTISVMNQVFPFAETVPISALHGAGLDVLRGFFSKYLPEGIAYFPEDQMTDTPERVITGEFVREQIIRNCFQEVPYGVAVLVEAFKETEKLISIYATIYVEKKSHKKIIIGKNGSMLKKVGRISRLKMEQMLGTKVFLSLHVKIAQNWINNPRKLSELGYSKM